MRAADGHHLGVGDTIVTRRNDRRLRVESGWVKNGDTWTVTTTHPDGSLDVTNRLGHQTRLPADYVTGHVELGYASTIHRTQGSTVDTAHALITTATMSREALYVAATRARTANHLYVDATREVDRDTSHGELEACNAREALTAVLRRSAAESSAHSARAAMTDAQVNASRPAYVPTVVPTPAAPTVRNVEPTI